MSAWVLVLRGFDLDEQGILDVEQRIKAALPELEPRCTTVMDSVYDVNVVWKDAATPPLARVVVPVGVPEHEAVHGARNGHRVRSRSMP